MDGPKFKIDHNMKCLYLRIYTIYRIITRKKYADAAAFRAWEKQILKSKLTGGMAALFSGSGSPHFL